MSYYTHAYIKLFNISEREKQREKTSVFNLYKGLYDRNLRLQIRNIINFAVNLQSIVVNYDHKLFIVLATGADTVETFLFHCNVYKDYLLLVFSSSLIVFSSPSFDL